MDKGPIAGFILAVLAGTPGHAQAVITLPPPPAGFKTLNDGGTFAAMRAAGVADRIAAEKPNDGWPKGCIADPKISFEYGWSAVGSQQAIDIKALAAEDPATDIGGTRSEPAGKSRYKGGVIWWRKDTVLAVGTACRTVTLYSGSWAGYVGGKTVSVSAARVLNSKAPAQGWIDSYIDKVTNAVTRPH